MSIGRLPQITNYKATDWMYIFADPFGGMPEWKATPASNFFGNIPTPIVMSGAGRVINHVRIAAPSWRPGANAPAEAFIGIYPTLAFDTSADDEVHYDIIVPLRMAAGTGIMVIADWAYDGGADAGTVCWALEYKSIIPGEALVGGTTTITQISAGTHTSGQLVRTIFADEIEGCVAHDELGLRLYRDVDNGDTLATDAELVAIHFMFTSDKMGEAV